MKTYLIFDKNTKIYKGNEESLEIAKRKIKEDKNNKDKDRTKKDKGEQRDYQNCEILEYDLDKWKEFLNTYPEVIKIEAGELKSEKRYMSIEELKIKATALRNAYLRTTGLEWGDDWESCPQEIKDKRALARTQKAEIELITNEEDLIIYNNF